MLLRSLTAEVSRLDILLGVVPGPAGIGHRNRQQEAGTESSDQEPTQCIGPEEGNHSHRNRNDDRQQAGQYHFFQRCLGGNINAPGIIRFGFAGHDPLYLMPLAAYLIDHQHSCPAHGIHGQRAEKEDHQSTYQYTTDDFRIKQAHVQGMAQSLHSTTEGGSQAKGGEGGRANGKTLARSRSSIPHSV